MRKLISGLFFIFMFLGSLQAQLGTVRGVIIDDQTGETLIGVNVFLEGTTFGASTDLDGAFSIKADEGTYNLLATYISYGKLSIADVKVTSGEVNNIGQLRLKSESIQSEVVVITAKRSRNNETAMVTMQKKSANVMDGISSQTFKKVGDSDAGSAIKRVTGVSVEGGKYVYVRGLGDRYSKTTLNGMEVPGLDPDRNSIQLDIFPTNLIDNLTVYKTFSPDLAADFSGGSIDIITKDFPEERNMGVSISLGYNPVMNLNSEFLSYESSNKDNFANGASSRSVPVDPELELSGLQFSDPELLAEATSAFDPTMGSIEQNSMLNTSFGFNSGNQFNREKVTYGYNFGASYSRKYTYFEDIEFSEYATNIDRGVNQLVLVSQDSGRVGIEEVFWSAFLSGSVKKGNSSASIALMNLQNGLKQASILDGRETGYLDGPTNFTQKHVLYYNQRAISSALVTLKQAVPAKNLEFTFRSAPTIASNKEPDFRQTVYEIDDDRVKISGGNGALVQRVWRDMEEFSLGNRFDAKFTFKQWSDEKSIIKAGAAYNIKDRNFDVFGYRFEEEGTRRQDYSLDPNDILREDNIFNPATRSGVKATGVKQKNNVYEAGSDNLAFYLSHELPINNVFKVIYGARIESFKIRYTGQKFDVQDSATDIFNNDVVLDETNLLPSLGIIYNLMEDVNVRLNYSQTVARPSFKEKSEAVIIDALTGRTFIGNLDLEQTEITNYDFRIEKFYPRGQLVSVSAFYKKMEKPIEMVPFSQNATSTFTPRNSSDATLIGMEFDGRKNLSIIKDSWDAWSVGFNLTLVRSRLDRREIFSPGNDGILGTSDDQSEYDERVENKRDGEQVDKYRELQGQSPYVVNTYIQYRNDSLGWDCNLSYNVQGKRLAVVGISRSPSVYEQPFHSLNFKTSKTLGKDNKMSLSLSVENILNDQREKLYESFGADEEVFTRFSPQRTFTLGFSYKL